MNTPLKAGAARPDELHVSADLAYQQRTWRVQRVGWVVLLGILVAAALGVFGSGVLSRATAGSQVNGLWVEYDRFTRRQSPSQLIVYLDHKLAAAGRIHLVLRRGYLRAAQIESLFPHSTGSSLAPERAVLNFDVRDGAGPLQVVIHLKFDVVGAVRGEVSVQGGPTVAITHWVYP